jgi:hypothetical protein
MNLPTSRAPTIPSTSEKLSARLLTKTTGLIRNPVTTKKIGIKKEFALRIQRKPRFDRYGDTPDSLIDELTTLKAAAEARLSICGDDHKSAAALMRANSADGEVTWSSG